MVSRDYEREEQLKWSQLRSELQPGLQANESEFVPLDMEEVIDEARGRWDPHCD